MFFVLTEIDLICWCRKLVARFVWTVGTFSNKNLSYSTENYREAKILSLGNISAFISMYSSGTLYSISLLVNSTSQNMLPRRS